MAQTKARRKPRKPMTQKQYNYIVSLAEERGLRWAKPFDMEYTSTANASALITELKNIFSLTMGPFKRTWIDTGVFEVVDEAKAKSFK